MESFVKRNVENCVSLHNTDVCHKQYHYTDVAIQRAVYVKGQVGTADQDIVSAISAAVAVLQGNDSPPPFKFASKKEALRVLTHYVGDIHQPLHVAAVYLDPAGNVVDPDMGVFNPQTETRGGNDLLIGNDKLHGDWDFISGSFTSEPPTMEVLMKARAVPLTDGPMSGWSTAWATESLIVGKSAFMGIMYSIEDAQHHYRISLPAGYAAMRIQTQQEQIVKAGSRLAQILRAIWPD
jgi:hypothetical protein